MTTIIIPYQENKDKTILLLLDYLISGPLKIPGFQKLENIKIKLDAFREGKDLLFDIPSEDLPIVLRRISDDGFIYKPDHLKKLQSDHLTTIHNYRHITHQDFTADITVLLNETKKSDCSVTVTDNSITREQKAILIFAIKTVLQTTPKKESSWDIDVKKVSSSNSLTTEILQYVGQRWTEDYFKT